MASNTMPDGNAPSPITATAWRSVRPLQIVTDVQPQQRRDAGAGVPRHEQVVGALGRIGITHQAAFGANRAELVIAAGDQLVRIDLMPGVPDQPIVAEVEHAVQGQAQFDDAQVRGEVGRPRAQQVAQHVADFGRQLLQLRRATCVRSASGDSIFDSS